MQGLESLFDSVEKQIGSYIVFYSCSKGVEFGEGFSITAMKGSEANDGYTVIDGKIETYTNHNGGILGGITTGMPLIFQVAVKPTPSIGRQQKTVDIKKLEEVEICVKGRHDPCIVPRVVPVVEAATALTILDFMLDREGEQGFRDKLRM